LVIDSTRLSLTLHLEPAGVRHAQVLLSWRKLGMSFIGVTRLKVRSVRFLPSFVVHALRTRRQVREAPGFQGGSLLADRSWTFWTMTRGTARRVCDAI
jgi:hypothetical protein